MSAITAEQVQTLQDLRPTLRIVTPSSTAYDEAITRPWPTDKRPAGAIAFPTSTDDVVTLVQFVGSEGIQIAVKGGGHGHYGSSTTGGLCIDLSLMVQISVDAKRRQVSVQGGATWDHVYPVAAHAGLAIVGGETSNVGVGGLVLHGGYGWLTGANGLAVDNVLEMEVVLSSGVVKIVSPRENQDLFWAMRGAGGSFGVVTKFVLRAFDQSSPVWFGYMILGPPSDESLMAIVEVCNKVLSEDNRRGIAALNWALQPISTTCDRGQGDAAVAEPELVVAPFYNGPEESAMSFFEPLLALNPKFNTCKALPFIETLSRFRGLPPNTRIAGGGSTVLYPFKIDLIKRMVTDFQTHLRRVSDARVFGSFLGFEVHNAYKLMNIGQDGTAYPARGNHANIRIVLAWKNKASDDECKKWLARHTAGWLQEFKRRQKFDDSLDPVTRTSTGLYPNYDGKKTLALTR